MSDRGWDTCTHCGGTIDFLTNRCTACFMPEELMMYRVGMHVQYHKEERPGNWITASHEGWIIAVKPDPQWPIIVGEAPEITMNSASGIHPVATREIVAILPASNSIDDLLEWLDA